MAVRDEASCKAAPHTESCHLEDGQTKVDASQVFFLESGPTSSMSFNSDYIIVGDTGNHCIRLLDLKKKIVKTIAGRCGIQGFMDGPLGNNLLNTPTKLGMDDFGNIWIYETGNSYIRMLSLDPTQENWTEKGLLHTMIKGVCNSLPSHIR